MNKRMALFLIAALAVSFQSLGQCAMCKTTVVNNVSHGELSLAEGLNFGIVYLFATPYLAVGIIGFLWYKNSRKGRRK